LDLAHHIDLLLKYNGRMNQHFIQLLERLIFDSSKIEENHENPNFIECTVSLYTHYCLWFNPGQFRDSLDKFDKEIKVTTIRKNIFFIA
jgi:hypothetical protein